MYFSHKPIRARINLHLTQVITLHNFQFIAQIRNDNITQTWFGSLEKQIENVFIANSAEKAKIYPKYTYTQFILNAENNKIV